MSTTAQKEAQQEWDQVAHLEAAVKGQEPRQGSADPFPFHHDPWYAKATVLTVVFLPLLALGYLVYRLWGGSVGGLELGLLLGFWAFTGICISVGRSEERRVGKECSSRWWR